MRAVADYTRLSPAARLQRLISFNERLRQTNGSKENFKEWNFELDKNLIEVSGRCLQNESIYFGNNKT